MLNELLVQSRDEIQKAWIRHIFESYQPQTQQFLHSRKDAFANPVGAAVQETTGAILDHLVQGGDEQALGDSVQHFIRIRAVQDFTVEQAVGWVYALKRVVRERVGRDARAHLDDLLQLESAIDQVALVCFSRFVEAREKLFQMQAKSVQRETHMLVSRMNRMSDKLLELQGAEDQEDMETDGNETEGGDL